MRCLSIDDLLCSGVEGYARLRRIKKKYVRKSPVKCLSFEPSRGRLPRAQNACPCVPAGGGPQHGRRHHRCAGACTHSGHIPIELSHASMIDTTTDPPRLSSASRANHSSHADVSMSALNVRIRSLVCCQESMVILGLSTVGFEFKARGGKVSSACPSRCPNPPPLACIRTLLPLTFCAVSSTEQVGVSQADLHLRWISTSFHAQRPLGAFLSHFLKLFPARDPFAPPPGGRAVELEPRAKAVP